jgi:hypothetical protein
MCLRRIVSISVKVCRACHRLALPDSITCPHCPSIDLTAIRCRVDKLDLKDYHRVFQEGGVFSTHPKH